VLLFPQLYAYLPPLFPQTYVDAVHVKKSDANRMEAEDPFERDAKNENFTPFCEGDIRKETHDEKASRAASDPLLLIVSSIAFSVLSLRKYPFWCESKAQTRSVHLLPVLGSCGPLAIPLARSLEACYSNSVSLLVAMRCSLEVPLSTALHFLTVPPTCSRLRA
jgi:hypothetical protein